MFSHDLTDQELDDYAAERAEAEAAAHADAWPVELSDITEEEMERALAEADAAYDLWRNA